MTDLRFDVRLHKAALREYKRLDHSVALIVDKALEELEIRADKVGKPLGKKRNINLTGCKEIKLRDTGIRIVFTVTPKYVHVLQIVIVLAIETRADDVVFQLAAKRCDEIKAAQRSNGKL